MTSAEGSWIGTICEIIEELIQLQFSSSQASIFGVGAIFGGLISGYLGQKIGPKSSLTVMALVDISHWVLMSASSSLDMMLVARFLAGLAAASYSPNITIFVAEISEACHRGVLLGLTIPIMGLGVLAVYIMGMVDCYHLLCISSLHRINRNLFAMVHRINALLCFSNSTSHFEQVKLLKRIVFPPRN